MSKNKKLRNIIILVCANVLALTMLITVLIVSSDGNKSNNDEIIVKDNVSVIVDTGEPDGGNIPIEVLDDKLVFNTDPKYPDGEVLVAGIIDTAPGGFIRKVISTAKEGEQYIVKTELGLLTDVFEQAHIKKSFVLTEDNAIEIDSNNAQTVANTKANKNDNSIYAYADEGSNAVTTSIFDVSKEYMFEKEFEKEIIKGLSVKANIEFGIQVEVELDIKKGDIIFSVIAYDVLDGGASAEFGAAAEFEEAIFEKHLPNIQFFIYVVPVVITNEFQLMVGGEASVEGSIQASYQQKSENTLGFRYDSKTNKVTEINEKKYNSDGLQWGTELEIAGSGDIGVYIHLITKLYDCTGADISVGVKGSLEGALCITSDKSPDGLNYAGSIDLKIAPSISGNLVVTIPIIDKELADLTLFDLELKPFWEKHWDSGSDWEQDVQSAIFNVFAKLPEFTLKFGRWESYLRINPDGTFSGHGSDIVFQDVDSSQTSDDRYWGDVSDFNGKFTINKKISNYEYSIKLDYLNIEGTVGEVKEEKLSESDEMEGEGIMTITTVEPLGFENADEFLLYLPGKSKEDLSESHLEKIELMLRAPEWEWREKEFEVSVNLPFYVLCNMEEEEDIGTFVAFTD